MDSTDQESRRNNTYLALGFLFYNQWDLENASSCCYKMAPFKLLLYKYMDAS